MKLYILVDKKGRLFDKAYTDPNMVYKNAKENYSVKEVDLPFIGRSVCYVECYYGYDYTYDDYDCYDVIEQSNIFACVEHAKNHQIWKDAEQAANCNPDEYIIHDTGIASRDEDGSFIYGDAYECKFNVSICRIRVIKSKTGI